MKDNSVLITKRSKIALILIIIGLALGVLVQIQTFINLGKNVDNPIHGAMLSMTYIGIFFHANRNHWPYIPYSQKLLQSGVDSDNHRNRLCYFC